MSQRGESAHCRQGIDEDVKEHGCNAAAVRCLGRGSCRCGGSEADQQIAAVRDGRIGHQAADIALPESADVANCHRENGQDQGELPGELGGGRHRDDDEADERRNGGDFWRDGEQSGVGAGRPLIDVRRVELQWSNRQLETKSRDDQHESQ